MIWVVDDQEVEVLFSTKEEVEVPRWTEQKKVIRIPLSMQKAEAVWTIRNFLRTKQPKAMLFAEERLAVFDKQWPVKLMSSKKTAFIKDGMIHCYTKSRRLSDGEQLRLKEELLQQIVSQHVGQWEEILDLLIPRITFRKLKGKPYIVQRQKEGICFNKELLSLPLQTLAYCVFQSVVAYGGVADNLRKRIVEKHFPTAKTLEKTISHFSQALI